MVEHGDGVGDTSDLERLARRSEAAKGGWERTVQDMRLMATDREDEGYETLTIPAGDTAPKPPQSGDTDRFGLSYVIPDNKVDPFEELHEAGEFSETDVYQAGVGGIVFIATECRDPDSRIVIFIAGAYEMRHAAPLVRAATDRGEMYTHVGKLDGTHLGTFAHDDVSQFFPDPGEFYAYEGGG